MAETGKYEAFRTLLKDGIGTRGKKEFADETGLTRETVSRLLNKETISQPSKETLIRISKHINNCTINDLLESCGYPRLSLEEEIKQTETDFLAELNTLMANRWDNVLDLVKEANNSTATIGFFGVLKKEQKIEETDSIADYEREATLGWSHGKSDCMFDVKLRYVKNSKDKPVFIEAVPKYSVEEKYDETDKPGYRKYKVSHTVVVEKDEELMMNAMFTKNNIPIDGRDAAVKLFDAIFGGRETYYVTETILGLGFSFPLIDNDEGVAKYISFICNHASSFAATIGNPEMFDSIVSFEGTANEFNDMLDKTKDDMIEYITKIMSYETGKKFEVFYPEITDDEKCEFDIMCRCTEDEQMNPDTKLMFMLCEYAKEFGIEEFGAMYHEEMRRKKGRKAKTKNFYLSFRKN